MEKCSSCVFRDYVIQLFDLQEGGHSESKLELEKKARELHFKVYAEYKKIKAKKK